MCKRAAVLLIVAGDQHDAHACMREARNVRNRLINNDFLRSGGIAATGVPVFPTLAEHLLCVNTTTQWTPPGTILRCWGSAESMLFLSRQQMRVGDARSRSC